MSNPASLPIVPMIPTDATPDAVFPDGMFDGLSPREQQAILYYLQSGNKAAAYTAAGFKSHSDVSHHGEGHGPTNDLTTDNKHEHRFFARPKIAEAVERAQALLTARAGVLAEDILAGLKVDAYADVGELYKPGTFELKPVSHWPEDLRRSVQEITTRTMPNGDTVTTLKLADRIKAKELLGKHKRLWEPKQPQGHGRTLVIVQNAPPPDSASGAALPARQDVIDAGSFQIRRPALPVPGEGKDDAL